MFSHVRVGAAAVAILFALGSVMPADAQHRQKSGSSSGSGAKAAPRAAQGSGGASAAPRQAPGRGGGTAARPAQPPAGSRPATGPNRGQAAPRPAGRPGYGGYYPGYGNRGHYPYYGYRGYYPGYGYGGYYGGYYPGFYFGLGAFYGPYYYSPWFYSSYYYGAPYYPYDYGYYYGAGGASLKVEVKPVNAEVYVDGHLAGIVDQFDGMFQSLSVEPGGHGITVYLDGFRSIRQQLYLSAGSTYRIKGALEPLAPGEQSEPRPQPAAAQDDPQVQMVPQYRSPAAAVPRSRGRRARRPTARRRNSCLPPATPGSGR